MHRSINEVDVPITSILDPVIKGHLDVRVPDKTKYECTQISNYRLICVDGAIRSLCWWIASAGCTAMTPKT